MTPGMLAAEFAAKAAAVAVEVRERAVDAAEVAADQMRTDVPVDTGTGRDSIEALGVVGSTTTVRTRRGGVSRSHQRSTLLKPGRGEATVVGAWYLRFVDQGTVRAAPKPFVEAAALAGEARLVYDLLE